MKYKDKISFYTALYGAKLTNQALHTLKRAGTSLPGLIAMKISKDFLSYISCSCNKSAITVTGTNGKTTTSGILAHIIKTASQTVLHNEKGANMLSGIATSLAVDYKPFSKFDYAVLESDEAYLTKLYDYLQADYLVITNLFRDQLDRYGELDTTAKKIQEAISKNKKLRLFVNADDPMLSGLGTDNEKIYYGFEQVTYKDNISQANAPAETVVCNCKNALSYNIKYYAHIGHYYCENCKKHRPTPKEKAYAIIHSNYSEIYIKNDSNGESYYKTNLVGLYNAYNVLAAITVARELKISDAIIQNALDTFKSMFGRAEKLTIKNRELFIQLIKNPTGATEVIRTVNKNTTNKILIIINDDYADGRDISWLWEADFELLSDFPNNIIVSGKRAYDMAVRMKYAGFDTTKIIVKEDIKNAIEYCIQTTKDGENIVIMPTYTALLHMQKFFPTMKQ